MDSILTMSMPNLNAYVTAPEVNIVLSVHTFQEAVHSQSYGYILESVVPAEDRQSIYDLWREDAELLKRNKFIADVFQEFQDRPTEKSFVKACFAQYLLEGIYFFSGFAFFYSLARAGKMVGTTTEIRFINRDEITHLAVFINLISALRQERPDLFDSFMLYDLREMAISAAKNEIAWGKYAIGDRIEGLSSQIIEEYIEYITDVRMKAMSLEPIFNRTKNPMAWLSSYHNLNEVKADFFEQKVTNYRKSSGMGLDDI